MKFSKAILSFLILLPTIAQAKVVYNKKPMVDWHIYAIKGFLHDVATVNGPETKLLVGAKFARAIVWLEGLHKDKKTHEITSFDTEDRALVQAAVKYLSDIQAGKDKEISPKFVNYWANKGKKVIAKYKEHYIKKDKGQNEVKIDWKLELKK